jgi:hypothetical protein
MKSMDMLWLIAENNHNMDQAIRKSSVCLFFFLQGVLYDKFFFNFT